MKICKICGYPEIQCQCTQQEKNAWLWEYQASLEECLEQCEVQIRNLQDEIEIFGTYPEEKAAIIQEYEEEKAKLDYHMENSFDIDDDFAEIIPMLWAKGYDTRFCCSGHPEKQEYSFYIAFANDYDFNFTSLPLTKGWRYCRRNEYGEPCYSLYYTMPTSVKNRLKKGNQDLTAYFQEQRKILTQWIQNLPPARIADYHQKLRGHGKSHSAEGQVK